MALVVAGILTLVRWITKGGLFIRTPLDWPILGLVTMAGISLLVTPRMDLTVPQVGRLLLGIAFFYSMVDWTTTQARLQIVLWGLASAGLVLCVGAPFGVNWELARYKSSLIPQSIYDRFVLLGTDTINPNVMAGYLALLIPCIITSLLFEWSQPGYTRKALYALVVFAMTIVLILTQSRAGLLAASAGIAASLILRSGRIHCIPGLFIIIAILIGFFLVQMAGTEDLNKRLELWSRGWYILQYFAITGIGMGSFPYITEQLYPMVLQETLPHSHNLFLQVAIDLGIPGLIAWLVVLTLVIKAAWQTYQRTMRTQVTTLAGFAAGILGAQVALTVHGMFDAVTWGMVRPAVLVWGIWGAAIALEQVSLPKLPSPQR